MAPRSQSPSPNPSGPSEGNTYVMGSPWRSVKITNDVAAAGHDVGIAVTVAAGGGSDHRRPAIGMGLSAHVPAFELAGMGKAAMSLLLVELPLMLPGEDPMVTIMVEMSLKHSGVLAVPISVIVPVNFSEGLVAIRMVARSLSTVVTIVAMNSLVRPPLVANQWSPRSW